MSRGVNKAILIGNLGRDPELSYLPSGMAVVRLSLATTESRKKEDGSWEDHTEWHRVVVFGKSGESISQKASKGSQIYVEGRIHYDSYERDGVKRYYTDIIANIIRLLGRREDADGRPPVETAYGGESAPIQPEATGGDVEDDLPF